MSESVKERLASMPAELRRQWLEQQSEAVLLGMQRGEWWYEGRPEQFAPGGDWFVWVVLSGRGWGKTRAGAEWLINQAIRHPKDRHGNTTEWLVIAETLEDARTFCIKGPSGINAALRRRGYREVRTRDPQTWHGIPARR